MRSEGLVSFGFGFGRCVEAESAASSKRFHCNVWTFQMVVNGKRIKILAASLSGYNVKNCEHPCSREPCTNGGTCLPENDGHSCLCPLGYKNPSCESRVSYEGANPMFFGNGYLFYSHQITHM